MRKLVIVMLLFSCSIIGQGNLEMELQQIFNKELAKENVHNAFLKVHSKSMNIDVDFYGGKFQNGDPITVENPFYIASVGKTFTAVSIAILKEKGKLSFNDKISEYLSDNILKNLHVFEGVDYSNEITIAQLLQHRSGLRDYFEDTTIDGTPNIMHQLFINPSRNWIPNDLIQFSKDKMKPLFPPGKGYHYTDTEYVLLGLIIEEISGLELHSFFMENIFNPLKMNNTYMNLRSKPIDKTKAMAEIYADIYEVSSFESLSADWAGGGVVSINADLLKFQKALLKSRILKKQTFNKMQQWIPETQGMEYGFGLRKVNFKKLNSSFPNFEIIGHSGSTGSFMFYCQEIDVFVSGTLNQTEETKSSYNLIIEVLTYLNKLKK